MPGSLCQWHEQRLYEWQKCQLHHEPNILHCSLLKSEPTQMHPEKLKFEANKCFCSINTDESTIQSVWMASNICTFCMFSGQLASCPGSPLTQKKPLSTTRDEGKLTTQAACKWRCGNEETIRSAAEETPLKSLGSLLGPTPNSPQEKFLKAKAPFPNGEQISSLGVSPRNVKMALITAHLDVQPFLWWKIWLWQC